MRYGGRLTIYHPRVRGDSLHGWTDKTRQTPAAFALPDIGSARVWKSSRESTNEMALGLLIVAVLTLSVAFLFLAVPET